MLNDELSIHNFLHNYPLFLTRKNVRTLADLWLAKLHVLLLVMNLLKKFDFLVKQVWEFCVALCCRLRLEALSL